MHYQGLVFSLKVKLKAFSFCSCSFPSISYSCMVRFRDSFQNKAVCVFFRDVEFSVPFGFFCSIWKPSCVCQNFTKSLFYFWHLTLWQAFQCVVKNNMRTVETNSLREKMNILHFLFFCWALFDFGFINVYQIDGVFIFFIYVYFWIYKLVALI